MTAPLFAGLAPENVVVVVNGGSRASVAIAEEYVRLRGIPAGNVITLERLSHVEQMPVEKFREEILGPVLKAIDERKLTRQISCIAYSADFPTAIHLGNDIGPRKLPQILTPVASINGLTFLHGLTMARDIRYLDLNTNFYARRVITGQSDSPWQPLEQQTYAEAMQRLQEHASRRDRRQPNQPVDALFPDNGPALSVAVETLLGLKRLHPQSPDLLYNLACGLATVNRHTESLETLREAVRSGWWDHRHAARDRDLVDLRERADFKTIIEDMKAITFEMQPARGFRANGSWLPNGEPAERAPGARYLLSTVLAVTAGRGNTLEEALANLRRSVQADGTKPAGTIYFLRNGDIRSTTREWAFEAAVTKLKSLGVNAAIEEGVLPQKKPDVAGAVIGIAGFDWPKSESTILPGAIVEHLTSFGGVLARDAGQTPLTKFLEHGAAGSSGTVTEPYAIQAKFPNAFLHVHYVSGCTLSEAFYQSVTGPYQLLIVGDPLCCPWKKSGTVTVEGFDADKEVRGTITLNPKATPLDDRPLKDTSPENKSSIGTSSEQRKTVEFSLYVDGLLQETARPESSFQIDTTRRSNGLHTVTITARHHDLVESVSRWTSKIQVQNPTN